MVAIEIQVEINWIINLLLHHLITGVHTAGFM